MLRKQNRASQSGYEEIFAENLASDAVITETGQTSASMDIAINSAKGWRAKRQGSGIEIQFSEKTLFNTIVLKEPADHVRQFSIYCWDESVDRLIYRQDRIGRSRMCAMENTWAEKIKIVFDSFDDSIQITEIGVYHLSGYDRGDFQVTSYLTSGRYEKTGETEIQAQAQDAGYTSRFRSLTDVIFIGNVSLKPDGTLHYETGKENFKQDIAILKQINPRMKIRCTLMTGLVPENFKENNKAICRLVKNHLAAYQAQLAALVEETGLDGIDFDWEYPQLPHEWRAYSSLLIASKRAIRGKTLSVALWPYGIHFSKEAKACIDMVNIMAYDQFDRRGDHSSIFHMGAAVVAYFLGIGFTRRQLRLGIPFYGRTADRYGIWPSYDRDYGKWQNERKSFQYQDDHGNTRTSAVFLNGYAMVRDKTALALDCDLGGIMIFSTSADISYAQPYALHKAVEEVLAQRIIKTEQKPCHGHDKP